MKIRKQLVYPLGGNDSLTIWGSFHFFNSPWKHAKKRINFIMKNLHKWKAGKIYKHYDGWFFYIKFRDGKEYFTCFNCGKKIKKEDLYAYDEKKKPQFIMVSPWTMFEEYICNDCEWKYRPLPEVNF